MSVRIAGSACIGTKTWSALALVVLPEGIEAQTHRVIENLKIVLAGVGSGLDKVVFGRVYLTHFERDYAAMNTVYQSYFAPSRSSPIRPGV